MFRLQSSSNITIPTCYFRNCSLGKKSYFSLPKKLNNSIRALINIQNDDNWCFRWCLGRYLNLLNKNPAKIKNYDREFAK